MSVTHIFVSGDRSSVGKSSVCMALLAAFIRSGMFKPSELAYIKPATQVQFSVMTHFWIFLKLKIIKYILNPNKQTKKINK